MPKIREFIDFWVENSVHPDEQFAPRRNQDALRELAARMIVAANEQGFTTQEVEASIGDPVAYVSGLVRDRNAGEAERLANGK